MKKIVAYINTVRVHWLVEELEAFGISEMMVTEYFSPSSKISRMELLVRDDGVENVRQIIHRVGTTGEAADHFFSVEEYDPDLPSQIPFGKRTSKLEESRMKQLVNFMLRGSHKKIRAAFLLVTVSVLGVALFIGFQMNSVQRSAKETVETIQFLSAATNTVESAVLEEMLAVERFHRGEPARALEDFKNARAKLINAVSDLRETIAGPQSAVDALSDVEHRFHLIAGGMFDLVDSFSKAAESTHNRKHAERSHRQIMASLDDLRLQLLARLESFESDTRKLLSEKHREIDRSTQEVRVSLLLLAGAAIALTAMMWLLIERNVSRPIRKLMQEAKTIDTVELR